MVVTEDVVELSMLHHRDPILFLSRVQKKTDPNCPICRVAHIPSPRRYLLVQLRSARDIPVLIRRADHRLLRGLSSVLCMPFLRIHPRERTALLPIHGLNVGTPGIGGILPPARTGEVLGLAVGREF